MNKRDVTTKIASVEASLKRWQTRLKRAATKVNDLDRQRRRLQAQMGPGNLTDLIGPPKETATIEAIADVAQAVDDRLTEIIEAKPEKDIPSFLDRSDPLIAEKMRLARRKAEETERHRMPLTDKAALQYIKKGDKKKKARPGLA